jgi:hypothetical protein
MISGTYLTSGILLIISAQLFTGGVLNATTQTLCRAVILRLRPSRRERRGT